MDSYRIIMQRESANMFNPEYRAFLDCVDKNWYVETPPLKDGTVQGGTVTKVIRDKFRVPVCLEVDSGDGKKDRISVERISFFEPYNSFVSNYDDYEDQEAMEEFVRDLGYVFDEEECVWRHPETGDELIW